MVSISMMIVEGEKLNIYDARMSVWFGREWIIADGDTEWTHRNAELILLMK